MVFCFCFPLFHVLINSKPNPRGFLLFPSCTHVVLVLEWHCLLVLTYSCVVHICTSRTRFECNETFCQLKLWRMSFTLFMIGTYINFHGTSLNFLRSYTWTLKFPCKFQYSEKDKKNSHPKYYYSWQHCIHRLYFPK